MEEDDNFLDDMDQSDKNLQEPAMQESKLVKTYAYFLLFFQTVYRLSDSGLNVLLSFFRIFLTLISSLLVLPGLDAFIKFLPQTIYSARKLTITTTNITKYICCRSCHSIYSLNQGTIIVNGISVARDCEFIKYPNHTQVQHRKKCGTALMRSIRLPSGKEKLYPCLIYCYNSVINSLQEMLRRPGFVSNCELWRKSYTSINTGSYFDIYDGKIWHDFQSYDGVPFLSLPYNFALHLNVDWFQPFKHTQHSEGVIYLSILNLPRSERFLQHNVILVGIIPGPKEPKKHINSFLAPLVKELLSLWKGILMTYKSYSSCSIVMLWL